MALSFSNLPQFKKINYVIHTTKNIHKILVRHDFSLGQWPLNLLIESCSKWSNGDFCNYVAAFVALLAVTLKYSAILLHILWFCWL